MFRSRADGSGTPSMLFPSSDFRGFEGLSFAGSSSTLVFPKGELGQRDIWTWSPDTGAAPLFANPYDQWNSQVSPDGKWLAYISDESGRAEIYVRPFPSGTGRWQISKDEAERAAWSADSTELYFLHGTSRERDTNLRRIVSVVSIASPDGIEVSLPKQVFEWNGTTYYSLSPDRQRLLFSRRRDPPVRTSEIHAVLGWAEELRRLAPRKTR